MVNYNFWFHLAGYAARTKILSAAGEIRKEYETQLQLEEEEKRRKQQAEAIASEALIRKIQAEEQQQLAQLAQDELLAKTLAKKEIRTKFDSKMKTDSVSKTVQKTKNQDTFDLDEPIITKFKSVMHRQKTNIALISKIRAESYASSIKSTGLNQCKDSSEKMGSIMESLGGEGCTGGGRYHEEKGPRENSVFSMEGGKDEKRVNETKGEKKKEGPRGRISWTKRARERENLQEHGRL